LIAFLSIAPSIARSETPTPADTTQSPLPADSTETLEAAQAARIPGIRGRPDLLQHASLAFAIGVGTGVLSERPGVAAGVSISLGIAKELTDTRFDRTDLAADLLGAALAAALTWWISR
jgi:hypothetical protein